MFLAYTPLEGIPQAERYTLATDISLAALTGEGVFNFGEVVRSNPLWGGGWLGGVCTILAIMLAPSLFSIALHHLIHS